MQNVLYFMNVDWNWIKQRPHFIAEHLQAYYNLLIVNQYRYSKKGFQNRAYGRNIYILKVVPRIDRYRWFRWINIVIKRKKIKQLINRFQPDYLYLTHPEQYKWLPKDCHSKILYDCMDDHYGLSRNEHQKKDIVKDEFELCKKTDILIVSSQYLKGILSRRYGNDVINKAYIVRNAFGGKIVDMPLVKNANRNYVICYFGTISDWFDFELIRKSIDEFDDIEYLLIGPLHRNVAIPIHSRIRYIGTVEHEKLAETIAAVDCFIMPFILDESIKAVDPVKLYEYINFNRNVICVRYDEIERFSDFVLFYRTYEEFSDVIKGILEKKSLKYTQEMRMNFLMNNCWESRADMIHEILINNNLAVESENEEN